MSEKETKRRSKREAEVAVQRLTDDFEYHGDVENAEIARDVEGVLEALRLVLDTGASETQVQNALRTLAGNHIDLRDDEHLRPSEEWHSDDSTESEDLAPCEQWAEDLYQRLVSRSGIPERAVAVVGMGNDNHVYVPADPFSQEAVRAALKDEGYQPGSVTEGFGYRIVADFEPAEEDGDSE